MAFPKKQLKEKLVAAGVPDENLPTILQWLLDANADSISALQEKIDELSDEVKTATAEKEELSKKLNGADIDGLSKVKAEFDAYKKQVEDEKAAAQKMSAVEKALKEAGANETAVELMVKAIDLNSVVVENGVVKEPEKIVSPIKEKYAGLFGTVEEHGTNTVHPPVGGGKGTPDYDKMTDEEYYKATYGAEKKK